MNTAQLQLSDEIDQATQRLLDTARVITEADLRAPSLLPGWSRAHVLAHLACGADAMRNVLGGVRSGQERAAYGSARAREAGIENGAALRASELVTYLADSAMALRTVARQLPDSRWPVSVRIGGSASFPAGGLLLRRLAEVELHHCDLGTGYGAADWPAAFAAMELPEPMRSQREERRSYQQPALTARAMSAARTTPPYRPGQRLPGSWIGRK